MSEAFDRLKELLTSQELLTEAEIRQAEAELGQMDDEERILLSAELHDRRHRQGEEITLEQYLAATQALETTAPGSPEHNEALRIVQAYESAA
ncbi:MAG: hypothetical protein JW910_00425 [Anaerolineae bacterium]|nr:hypothetical protein [Anaerolineae bacterium]